jgi:20S proteasome alpha/beta subunit
MTTIIGIQGDGYSVVVADTRISSFDESGSAYQISTLGTGSTKMAANGK